MSRDIQFDRDHATIEAPSQLDVLAPEILVRTKIVQLQPSATEKPRVILSPASGLVQLHAAPTDHDSGLVLYDDGAPVVRVTSQGVSASELERTRVFVDGENGNLTLGGHGSDGDVVLRDYQGGVTGHISASFSRDTNVPVNIHPDAHLKMNCGLGEYSFGGPRGGNVRVRDDDGAMTIWMDGDRGRIRAQDIQLSGTDGVSSLKAELHELRGLVARLEARLSRLE